jgi:CheY-like chemotaxis protein
VVDDDPDSRVLMERVLKSEGYAVTTAGNGREALNQLATATPSVILLDLEMPVMDGRSFRQHQLQMPGPLRSVPVIVCSGSDQANQLTSELRPFACPNRFQILVRCWNTLKPLANNQRSGRLTE